MKKRILACALAAILLVFTLGTLFLSFHDCHFENDAGCVICQAYVEQNRKLHLIVVSSIAICTLILTCVNYLYINQRAGEDSSPVKLGVKLTD